MEKMENMRRISGLQISQSHVTLAIRASVMATVLVVFFREDLVMVFNDALRSDTTNYVLAVPFMFAYLIYRKRKMLRVAISMKEESHSRKAAQMSIIAGILLSVTAIFLYWYGSYTFTPLEYHIAVLPILTAGLTLILFNYQTLRQLAFPIIFLFLLTPPPPEILFALGQTLPVVSSEASNKIVNILGVRSTLSSEYGNPTIILTRPNNETVSFVVDIACSGIYSLIGFLLCILFIVYIIRDKPWKKLALLLVGLPLIYLLNIIRIAAMLLIGYYAGGDIAFQIFHLLGGWVLIFLGTLLLLGISERIFKTKILSSPTERCAQCSSTLVSNQSFCFRCARILKPPPITFRRNDLEKLAAVTLAIICLVSVQVPVFALTQGPAIATINTPSGPEFSTEILPELQEYSLAYAARDTDFEKLAKQDMSLAYYYIPINESDERIIVRIEIASALSSLHREETCLVTWPATRGSQPAWTQLDLRDIQLIENPAVFSRFCVFNEKATNKKRVVLYWFESATFTVNSTLQQKYVKISLLALPENLDNLPAIENRMVALALAIAGYWEPIKMWSPIAILISHNGLSLAVATCALLIATVILYALEARTQKRAHANAYRKLSKPDQRIVDMIYLTEKTATPTLEAISTKYDSTAGESISNEELLRRLVEAEKIGIVRSTIRSENDEPKQIWKTAIQFK